MARITVIMRMGFFLLLFQLVSPAFLSFSTASLESQNNRQLTLHTEQTPCIIPLLLKEKEEKEIEDSVEEFTIAQLIDFSDHRLVITELHEFKYNLLYFGQWHNHQPPLFTLFCSYII